MATRKKVETNHLYETETILNPIWKNVPNGTKFTGKIYGKETSGRIYKERGYVYLCQTVYGGSSGKTKLGYKYSCSYTPGRTNIHSLTLDPSFKIPEIIEVGSRIVQFNKGSIQVGCTKVTNALVRKIVKNLKD